jgi:hypothetical protein
MGCTKDARLRRQVELRRPTPPLALPVMLHGWRLLAAAAALVVFVAVSAAVAASYGGDSFWPALVTEFGATLLAVLLALEIESRREVRALERAVDETLKARSTEARKRLDAVRMELAKNQTSIGEVADGLLPSAAGGKTWMILHPQLLDGAWSASSERLGDLLTDYELVADLSIFYGRVEELRWRLRYRTQARTAEIDGMTFTLANEMRTEVQGLLERLSAEVTDPSVRPMGLDHKRRLGGSVTVTGALTARKISGDSAADDG